MSKQSQKAKAVQFLMDRFKFPLQLATRYEEAARQTAIDQLRDDILLHEVTGSLDCICDLEVADAKLLACLRPAAKLKGKFSPIVYDVTFAPSGKVPLILQREWPKSLVA